MFSFLKKKKADNRELYRRIDKKPLKYVTERDLETYVESVIGKEGRINIYDRHIIWRLLRRRGHPHRVLQPAAAVQVRW